MNEFNINLMKFMNASREDDVKELDFQKALIDAAKREGGYGIKMSSRHLAGIPDLLLKLNPFDATLIECKRIERKTFNESNRITIGTTRLQQITLKRFQKAGGKAGVVVLVDYKWPQRILITTKVENATFMFTDQEIVLIERGQGEPWPIREIMGIIHSRSR